MTNKVPTKVAVVIDLSVLTRMVSEVQASVTKAEAMSFETDANKIEWLVELNKATGLLTGVLTEAAMLTGELQQLVRGGKASSIKKADFMEDFLGGLKGPGNAN